MNSIKILILLCFSQITTINAQELESISTTSITGQQVTLQVPRAAINASEMAILVNDLDPQSVAVANMYQKKRNIPLANMVHLKFTPGSTDMSVSSLTSLKSQVDAQLLKSTIPIQAMVITWTKPWRVGCMGITSAFTFGYKVDCNSLITDLFYSYQYFNGTTFPDRDTNKPFTDMGFRPSMMLAGVSTQAVSNLIDRGVAADGTQPSGTVYFIRTTDAARSGLRRYSFQTMGAWNHPGGLKTVYIDNSAGTGLNYIQNSTDVFIYETGLVSVPQINTLKYMPGALADDFTSFGGQLTGYSGQMSALRWLEAGATASYGTVVEPYAIGAKFPVAGRLVAFYFLGGTAIEAYWRSVLYPGKGIFIGEPLARPFKTVISLKNNVLTIKMTSIAPQINYCLYGANLINGPFTRIQSSCRVMVTTQYPGMATITQTPVIFRYYKLLPTIVQ